MTRCYLKRSAKTAGALMVAFVMVVGLIDTRNRYNDFVVDIGPEAISSAELASKRLESRHRLGINVISATFNKTEHNLPLHHFPQDHSSGGNENSFDRDGSLPEERPDSADTGIVTQRFWDLVNTSSKGVATKSLFPEVDNLPNLWRPRKRHLNRDDDRVLAQLILGMEAGNNQSSLGSKLGTKIKTIYIPDSFRWWSKSKWRSPHLLQEEDCPGNPGILKKCAFSQSRDSMDALITVRDAFHTRDFNVPSNVLRFYFMLESPIFSHASLKRKNDLMATFYRGSDINTPYGKWVYHDPAVKFMDQAKDYAQGKTKMAAIFTSNCHPWNNRMGYVRELQKYIDVDVYGACGRKHCPRYNQKECYDMLKRDYRFYLSFENSNCRDYITEKLFSNAFENEVIPIVMGAHPEDYKAMCPEKSYIHVEDYKSPKELAEYMKHLANTPEEYNSYFRWKGTGSSIDTNFFCRVCAMVHYADVVPPPERQKEYSWNSDAALKNKICLPSGAWYWEQRQSDETR